MSEFKHLLNNHTLLERHVEKTTGEPVEALIVPIRDIHNPEKCLAERLPWLAWHRGVDFWNDGWEDITKRQVIAASVAIHRKKGTRCGVKTAIAATGVDAEISIDPTAPLYVPHTYQVKIDIATNYPSESNRQDIRYQIGHTQAARCNFDLVYQSKLTVAPKKQVISLQSRGKDAGINYTQHKMHASLKRSKQIVLHLQSKQAVTQRTTHNSALLIPKREKIAMYIRIREAV